MVLAQRGYRYSRMNYASCKLEHYPPLFVWRLPRQVPHSQRHPLMPRSGATRIFRSTAPTMLCSFALASSLTIQRWMFVSREIEPVAHPIVSVRSRPIRTVSASKIEKTNLHSGKEAALDSHSGWRHAEALALKRRPALAA